MAQSPPIRSFVAIPKDELQSVVDQLRELGYRTIGPCVGEGAVIYDDLTSIDQLPQGLVDEQDGGHYRLRRDDGAGCFDHVVGPHSLKNFLFPPRETIQELVRKDGSWQVHQPEHDEPPLAVIGVRSCDLHAVEVQDRTFLQGPYVDPGYQARREKLFLAAVNCRRAAATCFCHSMKTGPAVRRGFDIALTEQDDSYVIEIGTARGAEAIAAADWHPCSQDEIEQARAVPRDLEHRMHHREQTADTARPRHLNTDDIRDLLLGNLDHPRWEEVGQRCLACANCTLVCPTCFCGHVQEVADLTGDHVRRERTWASCFMSEHSQMSSGVVRQATAARYRQWLTHKLASWIDQYGVSGCVGCGRCITWCPVAIDLTEEVAAIRGDT